MSDERQATKTTADAFRVYAAQAKAAAEAK
jgi:hypothetical protein